MSSQLEKNLRKKNLSSSSISVNKTNNLLQTLMTRVTISVVTYLSFTSSFTDLLSVAFGITLIAVELFCLNQCLISILSTDMTERTLIVTAFEFAKGIAELKLTEGELGLYSAFILFDPSKYLLHGVHGYSINSWMSYHLNSSTRIETQRCGWQMEHSFPWSIEGRVEQDSQDAHQRRRVSLRHSPEQDEVTQGPLITSLGSADQLPEVVSSRRFPWTS